METFDYHQNEIDIYQKVLPEYKKTCATSDDPGVMFPELIGFDEERKIMVLQDMMGENFKMCDRVEQVNYYHAKMVLKQMAKMHACSAVEYLKDPKVFEKFDKGEEIRW